jgi:hypothetical protein
MGKCIGSDSIGGIMDTETLQKQIIQTNYQKGTDLD